LVGFGLNVHSHNTNDNVWRRHCLADTQMCTINDE
jgi:hypothetical protein